MKLRIIAGALTLACAAGLVTQAGAGATKTSGQPGQAGLYHVQFDRGRDNDRQRDDYNDRDNRPGQKWRPGEVLPGRLLNRVVGDWEERGLSRPPGGHQWVRVGEQFILVRGRDRMIARILNFD